MQRPDTPTELRAVLADIGTTPATVTDLLAGLDEDAMRYVPPGGRSCLDLVAALVASSLRLGKVAHDVLGHVPGAGDGAPAARPSGAMLQAQLRFLREHIVSTVDQQGADVWSNRTPAGRPLFAYAVNLQRDDTALLAELRGAAAAARAAHPTA